VAPEQQLDAILLRLEELLNATNRGDAINRALAAPPRKSEAVSLRGHDAVRRFREEAAQGQIRLDTANQFLALVRTVLEMAVTP